MKSTIAGICFAVLATAAYAQFDSLTGVKAANEVNVEAALISSVDSFVPGEPFIVGLHLKHAPHWHTYWEYAGDAGLPTTIAWQLPDGFTASPIQWPAPIVFEVSGIVGYGYEGEVVLPVTINTPADMAVGESITLSGMARWLECKELCIPGSQEISLTLTSASMARPSEHADLIQAFVSQVPRPLEQSPGISAIIQHPVIPKDNSEPFKVNITIEGESLDFGRKDVFTFLPIPDDNVILDGQPDSNVSAASATFTVEGVVTPLSPETNNQLRGVVRVAAKNKDVPEFYSISTTVTPSAADQANIVSPSTTGNQASNLIPKPAFASLREYALMMLFAFIGGLILNIMPCVLPVISLKVFAFVKQADESKGRILFLGVIYALGVLASFWILAVAMVALKVVGGGANWGALFQYPLFVVAFTAVVFVFSLNMLGVFEISAPSGSAIQGMAKLQHREGPLGAFFTGVLATLLATPCSAPILATALAFAFTQPTLGIFIIFTGIGAGLAFPFLLLAIFPAWMKIIPKPGPWMIRFKQIMGFLLVATAIWLLFIVGQLFQADNRGVLAVAYTLVFLLALGAGCWMIGSFIDYSSSRNRKFTIWVLALALAGVAYTQTIHKVMYPPAPDTNAIQWVEYTPDTLKATLEGNDLVFMDFTADWCLTCKSNEKLVLETKEVRQALRDVNAVTIKADFTRQDDDIRRLLESFGRSGVPLYVIYPRNGGEPIVLPEIITKQMVIDKLKQAAAS